MSSNLNPVTPNPGGSGQKSDNSSSKNDDLTVLVFKDNSVARTFKVPLGWISRLGLIVGIVTAVAVLGIFLSARFYFLARQASKSGDPSYVQALEAENSDLKTNLKQVQTTIAAHSQTSTGGTAPTPTVTVTVTATPTAVAPAPPTAEPTQPLVMSMTAGPGFTALPSDIIPALTDSPISIYEPKVKWMGRSSSATLKVQFFIQYTREDKGNQQGRIILLARGPQTVMSYPPGVLNDPENTSLIAPEKGEYFSVSHVREVKADFGPVKSSKEITSVEVFLIGADQKLLVHQILKPEAQITPVAPVRKAAPADEEHSTPPPTAPTSQETPQAAAPTAAPTTATTAATTAVPAVAPTATATPTQAAPNPSNLPGDL